MGKMRYCLIFLCLELIVALSSAAAPIAAFKGTPLSGAAPLAVQFNDLSSNSPNGWAWYFGDENFTAPWTLMNASAGWSPRDAPSAVALPDGSIVLTGGYNGSGCKNDTWRSTDNGATWTLMNASAGWSPRAVHSSVAMPDGSIVLMGGWDSFGGGKNDTWRSTDNGATWTQVNASAGWSARYEHSSVVMPDGSIVLMGGNRNGDHKNDVWRSTDNGATWTLMNASAGWLPRTDHSSVAIPDGSIVLMGGYCLIPPYFKNDVWRSTDNGATWTQVNWSAGWTARTAHNSVAMPDGSIVLMGGTDIGGIRKNDVWRSTDNGATWTQVNASAGWSARYYPSSVAMPDGSIVLMGGYDGGSYKNDVFRLMPAGSSAQNPSHTYLSLGNYPVALQAYNADGYNSMRKTGYVCIGLVVLPLPGFTNPPTDPDSDCLYEDLNANGFADWDDAVVLFWNTDWIQENEPVVSIFDFNHNGFIDWDDAVVLFWEV